MALKKLHAPKNRTELARLKAREIFERKRWLDADRAGDFGAAVTAHNALTSTRSALSVMTGDCAFGD